MSARPSVLITGGTGYLGRLVLQAFAQHRDSLGALVSIDVNTGPEVEGAVQRVLDVTSPELADVLREHAIDTVVHLASIVRPPKKAPPDLAWRVDVVGTRNVLDACIASSVRHLVVTSSGAAYGYHPENAAWIDEDDPLRGHPEFAYSKHKRLVEELLAESRVRHPELKQLVLRPGTILGDSTRSPITDLFEKPVLLGVSGSDSPFVFIWDADVVGCIVEGVLGRKEGVFNLAGDGAMTTREIAKRLGKMYLPIPAFVLSGALGVLSRLGLTQYGPEQVDFLRYRPVLSNRRLKEVFGYVPRKTSRETFEYWLSAHG